MNIPDEAEKRWPVNDDSPQTFALRAVMRETFKQGAEWSRREALREAADLADRVAAVNGHMLFGLTKTVPDALAEDIAVRIRALAEGEQG